MILLKIDRLCNAASLTKIIPMQTNRSLNMSEVIFEPEMGVKLDEYGSIDSAYYISKAHQLRAAYIGELSHSANQSLHHWMHGLYERFFCHNCQPSH